MASSCHDADSAVLEAIGKRRIAIAGNPNAGKSTVFNLLTGMRQHVGNYPGVTVEKKTGFLTGAEQIQVVDLPGTYSLSPKSLDEQIAYDVLTNQIIGEAAPDLIVCVVNANNLERNLYLASQILDLDLPTVVVLNMMDEVRASGTEIDISGLASELGVPVVPMVATRGEGYQELKNLLVDPPQPSGDPKWKLPRALDEGLDRVAESLAGIRPDYSLKRRRAESLRALVSERLLAHWEVEGTEFCASVRDLREEMKERRIFVSQAEVTGRYAWLGKVADRVTSKTGGSEPKSLSDRLDAVLLHRVLGPIIFAGVLLFVFQSIFSWATPVMDLIEQGMLSLGGLVRSIIPAGLVTDLLVDGVIAGVGNVLVFLPQILLLFFFLSLMESTGYMARSAFIMDKIMRQIGLSGGAVMPMMSGFACAIPAIMATRTMENQRDRLLTILVVPLISCSARLPVYTLFIAAFIPAETLLGPINYQGAAMFSLYMLGMVSAFVAAGVLRRILKGPDSFFVLELPPYRSPQLKLVLWRMYERAKIFVVNAGRIIFVFSILLWFAASFPKTDPDPELLNRRAVAESELAALPALQENDVTVIAARQRIEAQLGEIANAEAAHQTEMSFIGQLGRFIEPVMRPLGFDWKLSAGILSAFVAREVIIGALGTLYSVADADENSLALRDHLRSARNPNTGQPSYTPLVAMSLLVFFVLALQCASTLAIARRELNSWKWPVFMWVYMTGLAYVASLAVYQGGLALGFG